MVQLWLEGDMRLHSYILVGFMCVHMSRVCFSLNLLPLYRIISKNLSYVFQVQM